MSADPQKKNLVIIGGGYGGVQAIKALDRSPLLNKYNIILIEKRTHFYHNIAALRASVEDIDDKVFIPYSGMLKKNIQVIHASATTLHKNEVIISPSHEELGSHIPFEYAIVATGAEYAEPAKLHKDTKEENVEHLKATREAVKAAKSIVIFGGGPVGIELAGEIKQVYPDKEVTIIERNASLINNTPFPEKFKIKAKETIEKLGVTVLLNEKVIWESGFGHDFKARTVRTESGKEIHADLQFVAFGTKPNGHLVGTLDSSLINQDTHGIKVRPTLQLDNPEYSHIYAVGDAIDLKGEGKLAMKVTKQSTTAIKNIQASVDGTALTDYKSDPDAMVITVGKNNGIAFLPFFGGITVGGWISKTLKSKSLFIENYWSALNVTPPKA